MRLVRYKVEGSYGFVGTDFEHENERSFPDDATDEDILAELNEDEWADAAQKVDVWVEILGISEGEGEG